MTGCPKCGFWVDCNCYAELVEKIHKKIESLQSVSCEGNIPVEQHRNTLIKELKFLLENESSSGV